MSIKAKTMFAGVLMGCFLTCVFAHAAGDVLFYSSNWDERVEKDRIIKNLVVEIYGSNADVDKIVLGRFAIKPHKNEADAFYKKVDERLKLKHNAFLKLQQEHIQANAKIFESMARDYYTNEFKLLSETKVITQEDILRIEKLANMHDDLFFHAKVFSYLNLHKSGLRKCTGNADLVEMIRLKHSPEYNVFYPDGLNETLVYVESVYLPQLKELLANHELFAKNSQYTSWVKTIDQRLNEVLGYHARNCKARLGGK